jgi:glycosyltransferase involved in cell wall biosynthesis
MSVENTNLTPRVMHIVPSLESGGLQRSILDLIDNVPDVEMSVAAINAGGALQSDFELRCPTIVLGDEQEDPHRNYLWFKPGPILELADGIRGLQPNIVQTHTFAAATVGRTAAKLAGIPVIIDTLHNTYSWKDKHSLRIDRFLGRFTDRIVCVSNAVKDYAIEQNPRIPADKYHVIYNGVDTSRFHPRANREQILERFGISPEQLVVGSISRLAPQKRVSDLIAASKEVLTHHPQAHFLVAGDGPMAGKLIDEVRSGDLEQSFTFTGNVRDTENLYPAIDVFTQTAEREGFGLSTAEAMASGTAVVAANTGAIPELIKHGETGLLYEVGDVSGLAESITTLLNDKQRRVRLGHNAIEIINNQFNITAVPENYRTLWRQLIMSKSA